MNTILVANVKGGCGKTTIATHLAAAYAVAGQTILLADVDRQRSALGWTERRPENAARVAGADWSKELGKTPKGLDRLVIDAPAALRRGQIEELVDRADVIVLPVQPGVFDEGATRRFLDRLEELKAVIKGRKPVAVVGNRLRPRTRASDRLDGFLAETGHRLATRLRDSALYPECAQTGLSLFDLPGKRIAEVRVDWTPLLAFLEGSGP
ncbi:MAG: ParA family protein [Rhodospirillaceae bacterium]